MLKMRCDFQAAMVTDFFAHTIGINKLGVASKGI